MSTPLPEPGAWSQLGAGALLLWALSRRRRQPMWTDPRRRTTLWSPPLGGPIEDGGASADLAAPGRTAGPRTR